MKFFLRKIHLEIRSHTQTASCYIKIQWELSPQSWPEQTLNFYVKNLLKANSSHHSICYWYLHIRHFYSICSNLNGYFELIKKNGEVHTNKNLSAFAMYFFMKYNLIFLKLRINFSQDLSSSYKSTFWYTFPP